MDHHIRFRFYFCHFSRADWRNFAHFFRRFAQRRFLVQHFNAYHLQSVWHSGSLCIRNCMLLARNQGHQGSFMRTNPLFDHLFADRFWGETSMVMDQRLVYFGKLFHLRLHKRVFVVGCSCLVSKVCVKREWRALGQHDWRNAVAWDHDWRIACHSNGSGYQIYSLGPPTSMIRIYNIIHHYAIIIITNHC